MMMKNIDSKFGKWLSLWIAATCVIVTVIQYENVIPALGWLTVYIQTLLFYDDILLLRRAKHPEKNLGGDMIITVELSMTDAKTLMDFYEDKEVSLDFEVTDMELIGTCDSSGSDKYKYTMVISNYTTFELLMWGVDVGNILTQRNLEKQMPSILQRYLNDYIKDFDNINLN